MNAENTLTFSKLPGFAAFILENHLETYTRMGVVFSMEEEVPLLRLFSHLSEEELISMSLQPSAEFLKVLVENRSQQYLDESIQTYVDDRMPEIGREDIVAKDITLGSFVRRKVFRKLLRHYTEDYDTGFEIMEELDRFVAASEAAIFKVYIEIQQEKITRINDQLLQGKGELLELQELADMGSYVWNFKDGSSVFTPGIQKILGISEMLTTMDFMLNVHPDDQARVKEDIERAIGGNGIFESEFRYLAGGMEKNIWSRGIVAFETGIPVSMKGNVMDITDKHKLITGLKESESLNKLSQALTHIGNWSWEKGTDLVTWSDEMYRIYGLEPQSEQITFNRFLSLIHPDDRERRIREIEESVQTQDAKDYVLRIVNPDGTGKVLRGRGEVIVEDGEVTGLVGTCQDITKEHNLNEELRIKSMELEKLNASLAGKNTELERINKELESFNYVASHDLQEPLRKIQIFTGRILESGKALPEETGGYFEKIIASSSRMRLLIDDLLKFSRTSISESTFQQTDLNLVLEEAIQVIFPTVEEQKMIVESSDLPTIEGIGFQLQQLFTNLLSNSAKYARQDQAPKVVISARLAAESEIPAAFNPSGQYHEITFRDNGIGFEQHNAEKIFDLFQRLHGKDEYSGTGIGLAICKKIMYNHNGFIFARSNPGEGSEFCIYFPERCD